MANAISRVATEIKRQYGSTQNFFLHASMECGQPSKDGAAEWVLNEEDSMSEWDASHSLNPRREINTFNDRGVTWEDLRRVLLRLLSANSGAIKEPRKSFRMESEELSLNQVEVEVEVEVEEVEGNREGEEEEEKEDCIPIEIPVFATLTDGEVRAFLSDRDVPHTHLATRQELKQAFQSCCNTPPKTVLRPKKTKETKETKLAAVEVSEVGLPVKPPLLGSTFLISALSSESDALSSESDALSSESDALRCVAAVGTYLSAVSSGSSTSGRLTYSTFSSMLTLTTDTNGARLNDFSVHSYGSEVSALTAAAIRVEPATSITSSPCAQRSVTSTDRNCLGPVERDAPSPSPSPSPSLLTDVNDLHSATTESNVSKSVEINPKVPLDPKIEALDPEIEPFDATMPFVRPQLQRQDSYVSALGQVLS